MSDRAQATRRGFLQGAVGISAFPSFIAGSALGQDGATAPSNRITMACIGVGGRGQQNLQSFLGHENCRIVAVCDVNAHRAAEAKKIIDGHYGNGDCTACRDYRDLLSRGDVDVGSSKPSRSLSCRSGSNRGNGTSR